MRPGALDSSYKGCCVCKLQRPERENENGEHRGTVEPGFFCVGRKSDFDSMDGELKGSNGQHKHRKSIIISVSRNIYILTNTKSN